MSIEAKQVEAFRKAYNCIVNNSRHQYAKPVILPIGTFENEGDRITTEVEYGLDVTFMREFFHQMILDAEHGREIRKMRYDHPALMEAWEKYKVLESLIKNNNG